MLVTLKKKGCIVQGKKLLNTQYAIHSPVVQSESVDLVSLIRQFACRLTAHDLTLIKGPECKSNGPSIYYPKRLNTRGKEKHCKKPIVFVVESFR